MRNVFTSMRALPLCFLIYVLEAAFALSLALPLGLELASRLPQGHDASRQAEWLERLFELAAPARASLVAALLAASGLWLLSPWLQMAWLSALARGQAVGSSLAGGARLWLRAVLVSAWVLAGVALLAAPWILAAIGVASWLADHPNERVHDLAIVACAAPILPCLLFGSLWHDLARARALHEGAFASARRSFFDALSPLRWLSAALWSGAGWGAALAAQFLASSRFGLSTLLALGVLQAASLLRLFLRGCWLAEAVACADEGAESGAFEARFRSREDDNGFA